MKPSHAWSQILKRLWSDHRTDLAPVPPLPEDRDGSARSKDLAQTARMLRVQTGRDPLLLSAVRVRDGSENRMNVQTVMCASCPFRDSPEALSVVRALLEQRALNEATPICHSTSGIKGRALPKSKQLLCRGARNFQLNIFHRLGVIDAPTDESWERKWQECLTARNDG